MRSVAVVALVALCACKQAHPTRVSPADLRPAMWDDIAKIARGTTVTFAMWTGDEERNRRFRSSVSKSLLREYNILLRVVPIADTADAINKLLNEKGAGKLQNGSIDLVWINGENF